AAAALCDGGPLAPTGDAPAGTQNGTDLMDVVRYVALGKGWNVAEDAAALRLSVPSTPNLPPLVVSAPSGSLFFEISLPLLPARRSGACVRSAAAHAALRLNAAMPCARVAVRDPAALMLGVQSALPPFDDSEDEVDDTLDGVHQAARHALQVFECL